MTGAAAELHYAYYPGCSLHATGLEYDASVRAAFSALDVTLEELEGWNCCGASSAHALSHNLALGLSARNLALIERRGLEAMAPCAACFNRLRAAQEAVRSHPEELAWLGPVLGASLRGDAVIHSPIGLLVKVIGLGAVRRRVLRPLNGLKAVSYYGCLLARPRALSELSSSDHPGELDELWKALGGKPLTWSYAVDCCGGALSIPRSDIARSMTQTIVDAARDAGADVIVTACPLCQANLEMRQTVSEDSPSVPALYFSEALGLAFGLPEAAGWWGKHLIDPRPLLREVNLA
jgi:heterodisulfide reductase subunit B